MSLNTVYNRKFASVFSNTGGFFMWRDSETELDFLDFDYLINILKDTIDNEELLPASIGVYGDWGSGKSSLIKMSMNLLEQEEDSVCLVFNGWLFEGYDDAKTALMGSILDIIQEKRTFTDKAKACISGLYKSVDKLKLLKSSLKFGADLFLTGGIGTITDITLSSMASKISEKADGLELEKIKEQIENELNNKTIRNDIKEFQKNFDSLLKETNIKRLVVFVDELDRCSPDTILETLEAIRLFLFVGNIAFIIGADERHIAYAVKKKFQEIEGIQIDIGKEYLEKMIQYPIRIPRLNTREVEFYITCLLFQKDLEKKEFADMVEYLNKEKQKDFLNFDLDYKLIQQGLPNISEKVKESIVVAKQLSSVLASGLNGNPRHCKRFLNSLDMRMKMAKYKNMELDRKVLAKVMMLEYFRAPLFRKIAQLQFIDKVFRNELIALESSNLEKLNELKLWKDDSWVQEWGKSAPSLLEVNLTPYFYVTRTSLNDKFNNTKIKLSQVAQDICANLLLESEVFFNSALKRSEDVSEFEAAEILEILYNQMMSDSTINNTLFKVFLKWGATRESLVVNTLGNLKGIHGSRISLAFLPLIKDFSEQTHKLEEIKEIALKWVQEKESLKATVEKTFK